MGARRAVEDQEDSSDEEGDPPARAPAEPAKYIGPSAGCTAVRSTLLACQNGFPEDTVLPHALPGTQRMGHTKQNASEELLVWLLVLLGLALSELLHGSQC